MKLDRRSWLLGAAAATLLRAFVLWAVPGGRDSIALGSLLPMSFGALVAIALGRRDDAPAPQGSSDSPAPDAPQRSVKARRSITSVSRVALVTLTLLYLSAAPLAAMKSPMVPGRTALAFVATAWCISLGVLLLRR